VKRILLAIFSLLFVLLASVKGDLPTKKVLTLEVAKKIAAASEAEAKKRGATVVIVVVDDGGHMLILERLDDTRVASVEVGIGKARTAAILRQQSNSMREAASPNRAGASQEAEITAALGTRSIVLVGMMGAGKSTIGRRLSARLRLPFLDADGEIEAAAGMSIPDIFESHGEPHFRDGEARVIARLLESGPAVLATGGGAFMREDTRNRVGVKAVSIWLKADADIIMRRVRRRADRPLLQTPDPEATVGRLISEREPVYQHADLTIWSRDVPHDRIVDECIKALHARLCGKAEAEPTSDVKSASR